MVETPRSLEMEREVEARLGEGELALLKLRIKEGLALEKKLFEAGCDKYKFLLQTNI